MAIHAMLKRLRNRTLWRTISLLVAALLIGSLVYICRGHNHIPAVIQSWGWMGIIAAVLLMAAFHLTPVPSDGLLIMYFKVFGIGWGMLYGWMGSILSAICIYIVAQSLGQELLKAFLPEKHLKQVDTWVSRRGQGGLFVARLLPIPAFVVNCAAGVLPSIRMSTFLWTAAVTIVPYLGSMAMVYLGATSDMRIWTVIGVAALVTLWIISCSLSGQVTPVYHAVRSRLRKGLPGAY